MRLHSVLGHTGPIPLKDNVTFSCVCNARRLSNQYFSIFKLFTLRDTTDSVDSSWRRRGGMRPVVVVSGVAVATLLIFCFCFSGFSKARAARVPLWANWEGGCSKERLPFGEVLRSSYPTGVLQTWAH